MLKTVNNKFVLIVIFGCLSLAGCSSKDDEKSKVDLSAARGILQYVPADSPYVLASIAPLPDDVMDKLEPNIDRMLLSYETVLQELFAVAQEQALADGADEEDLAKAGAVMDELSTLMSLEGLRAAGFDRESLAVVYGNGLLPVLRMELSDGTLFEDAMARLESSAGEEMDVLTLAGNAVRFIDADEVRILVAVLDKQVAISMAPVGFTNDQLEVLLGFTTPDKSIVESGKLQAIADKYSFNDYMLGYFDLETVAKTVTGDARGLDEDIFEGLGDAEELSEVCRNEIRSMAGIAPRLVMGYTDISTERFDSQAILELRSDIAEGLTSVAADVPGLGGDMGGLLSFGMSLDLRALREFVQVQLDAIEKDPYECEQLADIEAGAAQARISLAQPVMPMIYDFRGFSAIVENIEGLDMANQTPPTAIHGRFLMAMDNATAFVALGTMFSPELANLNLQPDSTPVLLDIPQAQMLGGNAYAALSEDALAVSIGDGSMKQLGAMLAADASDDGIFFNFSMDAERYYTFMGEAMAEAKHDDETPMTPAFQEAMQDVMLAIASMYDRMSVDMRFTSDGIVMENRISLGDE